MTEPTSGGFTTQVAGRTVIVRTGTRSQTVNICTSANVAGQYEERFRLDPLHAVRDPDEISGQESLVRLLAWLEERGVAEGPTGAPRPVPPSILADPTDPWVSEAVEVVDAAIDTLVQHFVADPYRHRVEHSLHTELMTSLTSDPLLGAMAMIGPTGFRTQLVQKEWPETNIRKGRGKAVERRGLFDLVVLSPTQLSEVRTLDQYRVGLLAPPIVIELGLDYGAKHLQGDLDKFENSEVLHGRLVHLTRLPPRPREVEQALETLTSSTIRVAYGYHDASGAKAIKLLDEPTVRQLN